MRKTIMLVASLLAFTACAHAGSSDRQEPGKVVRKAPAKANAKAPSASVARALVREAKVAITYTLKDPESVRFRNAAVNDYGSVCIEVNAKNSYGGYTGFTWMHYSSRSKQVENEEYSPITCTSMSWRGVYTKVAAGH